MKGLTLQATKALEKLIGGKFNSIGLDFLGLVPKISREKKIVFTTNRNSLTSLFLQALGSRDPSNSEEDALKVLLRIANGYVESLKERTTSKILNDVDAYLKNTDEDQRKSNKIYQIYNKEMGRAKNHMKLIANSESNKAVNTGTAFQITKVAESQSIKDPTVGFIVTQDDVTGFYEYVLHLLPDKKTPRVYKLSEIQAGYYTNGDQYPAISGLHPNCRCKLFLLMPGYGFDGGGKITYKGKDWDEFKYQREKYGLPNVPKNPRKKNGEWVFPN